jgi:hypothetical protein
LNADSHMRKLLLPYKQPNLNRLIKLVNNFLIPAFKCLHFRPSTPINIHSVIHTHTHGFFLSCGCSSSCPSFPEFYPNSYISILVHTHILSHFSAHLPKPHHSLFITHVPSSIITSLEVSRFPPSHHCFHPTFVALPILKSWNHSIPDLILLSLPCVTRERDDRRLAEFWWPKYGTLFKK